MQKKEEVWPTQTATQLAAAAAAAGHSGLSQTFVRTRKHPAKGARYSRQYGSMKGGNNTTQPIYLNTDGLNSPLWKFQKVKTSFCNSFFFSASQIQITWPFV